MTDQPPTSIEPWKPPEGSIIISQDQFEHLEELAKKRVNPFPWAILGLVIVLVAVIGSMSLGVILTRPIRTELVQIPATGEPTYTLTRTPTATVTLTPTYDIMADMQVIYNYYHYLAVSDMESAWNCLTLQFRRDSFGNDFEEFKDFWSRTGPVAVYDIKPESDDGEKAVALTKLYFHYEQKTRYYRFYLLYNPLDKVWQISRVTNTRPW